MALGCAEQGKNEILISIPPPVITPVGERPPTERLKQIEQPKIMDHICKPPMAKAVVLAEGNMGWKSLCKQNQIKLNITMSFIIKNSLLEKSCPPQGFLPLPELKWLTENGNPWRLGCRPPNVQKIPKPKVWRQILRIASLRGAGGCLWALKALKDFWKVGSDLVKRKVVQIFFAHMWKNGLNSHHKQWKHCKYDVDLVNMHLDMCQIYHGCLWAVDLVWPSFIFTISRMVYSGPWIGWSVDLRHLQAVTWSSLKPWGADRSKVGFWLLSGRKHASYLWIDDFHLTTAIPFKRKSYKLLHKTLRALSFNCQWFRFQTDFFTPVPPNYVRITKLKRDPNGSNWQNIANVEICFINHRKLCT